MIEAAVRPRFDPRIAERDRQLPRWVTPHIQTTALHAGSDLEASRLATDAHRLNPSATAIRTLCDAGLSIFHIVALLRQRYLADDVELYVDVTSAVLELRRLGLVASTAAAARDRPPIKFVMGIEDKTYFHWQLPILFESLIGQLPDQWEILVVVCNDHQPLSDALRHLFERYGVTHLTGVNHPAHENMDFASGGDRYVPLNRIEALRAVAPHVRDQDLVFLLDTDNFLYRELDVDVFPSGNALCANQIIGQTPFFSHGRDGGGVDLQKILESVGCETRLGAGGVAVFLLGRTIRNEKFVADCFRFTQIAYLLGKVAGLTSRTTWISEMPCFALSLTANAIPYEVIGNRSFLVDKARSVRAGAFYHYYGDLKDTSIEGAFYDSDWHKQWYFEVDFLTTNLDERYRAAVTPHEQYFFELAKRASRRLAMGEGPAASAAGERR